MKSIQQTTAEAKTHLFKIIKSSHNHLMTATHQTHRSQKFKNQRFCSKDRKDNWQKVILLHTTDKNFLENRHALNLIFRSFTQN